MRLYIVKAYAMLAKHGLRAWRDIAELMSLRDREVVDCNLGLQHRVVAAT